MLAFSLSQLLCACPFTATPVSAEATSIIAHSHTSSVSEHSDSCDHKNSSCDVNSVTVKQADESVKKGNAQAPENSGLAETGATAGPVKPDRDDGPIGQNWRSPSLTHTPLTLKVRLQN